MNPGSWRFLRPLLLKISACVKECRRCCCQVACVSAAATGDAYAAAPRLAGLAWVDVLGVQLWFPSRGAFSAPVPAQADFTHGGRARRPAAGGYRQGDSLKTGSYVVRRTRRL